MMRCGIKAGGKRERGIDFVVGRDLISYLNKSGDKFLSITVSFARKKNTHTHTSLPT